MVVIIRVVNVTIESNMKVVKGHFILVNQRYKQATVRHLTKTVGILEDIKVIVNSKENNFGKV